MNPLPILYYGVPSGCSFGSIVALEWLGQPYALSRIEMPEVVTGEAFRRVNPVGETPALLDARGHTLSESMAILNHIAARGIDRGLGYPQGSRDFDRLNRMLAYLNTTFFGAFAPLWYVLEHELPAAEKQALVKYGRARVEKAHAELEAMIGDGPWLLGEQRTVADAYFIGIARWGSDLDLFDMASEFPGIHKHMEKLEADPAVIFAHAIEQQRPAVSAGGFQGEVALEEAIADYRLAA